MTDSVVARTGARVRAETGPPRAWSPGGVAGGFVLAAWLVGKLAEHGSDRHVVKTIGLMVAGNVVIYAFGIAGLMLVTGMPLGTAIAKGLVPFLLGDALKIALAAGLLPGAWKLLNSRNDA